MRGSTQMETRPMSGALGAEIRGVDLANGADDGTFDRIRAAFLEHGVIVIRDQDLAPEQHLAFARRFGPINVNRFFTPVDGHPEVAEVRKEPDQKQNVGGRWHTDHSYDDAPALGSMIYAIEVPPVGGDTLFANLSLAFETLSDGMKAMLPKLRAVHSSRHVFGPGYKSNPGPERPLPQRRAGGAGRRAPGGDPPPRDRTQGALRQPHLHGALRRLDRGGVEAPARLSLRACRKARVLPAGCDGRRARSACGTTGRRGTWRSTTTMAIAG